MSPEVYNNTGIKGLLYDNKEIKILSSADDIKATLKSENDAKALLDHIKDYELISGLKINPTKTEGLWLG